MILKYEKPQLLNLVKLHLLVICIFIVLTGILTMPVIFQFTTSFAGIGGDTWAYIWSFWWFEKAFSDGSDPFSSQCIFYPNGIDFTQLTPFNEWTAFLLHPLFNQIVTWNILWFSGFVLGGYGTFLLCNHFLKKFFPSLIGGIIFSFSSYHTAHALGHLELITISWIPFFILFLFRTSETHSKINPLLAGLFFFLVSMSSWFYALFIFIFALVFFFRIVLFSKDTNVLPFFLRYSLIFVIGIFLSSPLLIPIFHSFQSNSSYVRPVSEFYNNSLNSGNVLLPTSIQTIVSTFHFPIYNVSNIEQMSYLGITASLFSIMAIIWFRNSNILFWTAIGSIFLVLSFGPELSIFRIHTGIPLPQQFLYNFVPGWSFFRDPNRFIVMVSLSTAMLASYSISNISLKINSKKFRIIFFSIVLFFILLEFSTVPFPTTTELVPPVYHLIKDDPTNNVVLETPIGGSGEVGLLSDPIFDYYQTIHGKNMYGGYMTRVPIDTQRYVQTYFLNQFVWYDEQTDIVKQNLKDVGISIFNYYDIGYVVVHKRIYWDWIQDFITNNFVPDITKKMKEILHGNNTFYEDKDLIVYKIPETKSNTPFIILGKGWHELDNVDGSLTRTTDVNSEIIIVNPSHKNTQVDLEMTLKSLGESHMVNIMLNNTTLEQLKIPVEKTDISIKEIQIKPGSNILRLTSDGFIYEKPKSEYEKSDKTSLQFYLITINNTLASE